MCSAWNGGWQADIRDCMGYNCTPSYYLGFCSSEAFGRGASYLRARIPDERGNMETC